MQHGDRLQHIGPHSQLAHRDGRVRDRQRQPFYRLIHHLKNGSWRLNKIKSSDQNQHYYHLVEIDTCLVRIPVINIFQR